MNCEKYKQEIIDLAKKAIIERDMEQLLHSMSKCGIKSMKKMMLTFLNLIQMLSGYVIKSLIMILFTKIAFFVT